MEAWHYAGPFRNIRLRFESRFQPDPAWPKRYYAGVTDEELHFLATTADLRALMSGKVSGTALEFSSLQRQTLEEVHALAIRLLQIKIPDGEGFVFGPGDWSDHPQNAWAGCISQTVPMAPCPLETVSEDTGHSARWPLWLDSFAAGSTQGTSAHHYVGRLKARLAWQLLNRVVDWDKGRPLMRNYLDGTNGWYRVGYYSPKFGYGPYAAAGAVYYGSWFLLAAERPEVRQFSKALCQLMQSTEPEDVVFRTHYYGAHETFPKNDRGLGETDIGGQGSAMVASCRIAKDLGFH